MILIKISFVIVLKPEKVTHVACGRAHTLICTGEQRRIMYIQISQVYFLSITYAEIDYVIRFNVTLTSFVNCER